MKKTDDETPDPQAQIATAFTQIAATLQALNARGGDAGVTEQLQGIQQLLRNQEKLQRRENQFGPEISHYNPLGDTDHPRPDLKTRMIWVGYELTREGLTREEIELLNRMQPGEYRVTKADGKTIPFRVGAKVTDSGKLEMLTFHFPCKGSEDRQNHAPMTHYLREALGEVVSLEAALARVRELEAKYVTKELVS